MIQRANDESAADGIALAARVALYEAPDAREANIAS
jgi:hypothetical protein